MKVDKNKIEELIEERVNNCINYEYIADQVHRIDTDTMLLSSYCMYESSKKIERLTILIILLTIILIILTCKGIATISTYTHAKSLGILFFAKVFVFNFFCTADSFFNTRINHIVFFISTFKNFKLTI